VVTETAGDKGDRLPAAAARRGQPSRAARRALAGGWVIRRSVHKALTQRIRAAIVVPGLLAAILALSATPAEAATLPRGCEAAVDYDWGLGGPAKASIAP
jgi:hypothetical protein